MGDLNAGADETSAAHKLSFLRSFCLSSGGWNPSSKIVILRLPRPSFGTLSAQDDWKNGPRSLDASRDWTTVLCVHLGSFCHILKQVQHKFNILFFEFSPFYWIDDTLRQAQDDGRNGPPPPDALCEWTTVLCVHLGSFCHILLFG